MRQQEQNNRRPPAAVFPVPGFVEANEDALTVELNGDAKLFLDPQIGPDGRVTVVRRPLKDILARSDKRG